MNTEMVVRAWEDPIYRAGLASEILASLPTNPAGNSLDELGKAELSDVLGASSPMAAKTNLLLSCVNKSNCVGISLITKSCC